MHYLEWRNAGNSGKLLLPCLRENDDGDNNNSSSTVQLFLYGCREDDKRLRALVGQDPDHTVLLFPSTNAILLQDFLTTLGVNNNTTDAVDSQPRRPPLTMVVLDATYQKAKNMAKHFLKQIHSGVRTVALNSSNFESIFRRGQDSYHVPGRVCTVEAVALALQDCGECFETVQGMVDAVRINNDAIDPGKARTIR
jgi:DTW domain-containing protein YfiP